MDSNKEIGIKKMDMEVTAKSFGNSSHILLPKVLLGKRLKISIEVID